VYGKNIQKMEAKLWDLEQKINDRDTEVKIAQIDKEQALRDLQKKQEECDRIMRSNEHKRKALYALTDEMEAKNLELEKV